MRFIKFLTVILLLSLPHNSFATKPEAANAADIKFPVEKLPLYAKAKILDIEDDGTFVLINKTRMVLGGIELTGEKTVEFLREHYKDQVVGVFAKPHSAQGRMDRHNRLISHIIRAEDGLWAQKFLLRHGKVRVRTSLQNRDVAKELLIFEDEARRAKRGIWSDFRYQIRTPGMARLDVGSFQIVEGKIESADQTDTGRVFLNFGLNWKNDFTVSIYSYAMKDFEKIGLKPMEWAGKTVRVRGKLREYNGPLIDVTHLEQIQLLE